MKSKSARLTALTRVWILVAVASAPLPGLAAFDVGASPPRFELKAKPGEVVREVVNIVNGAKEAARYDVRTADWEIDAGGNVQYFEDTPVVGSCRPWVRVERHVISVAPEGSRAYRFEVHVPEDATVGECRFALLVSSEAGTYSPRGASGIKVPVVGRLGIIVYVTVGEAGPKMGLVKLGYTKANGKLIPTATFHNKGDAHGRVFGSLEAKDALGRTVELVADQGAVMPQQRKAVLLTPMDWSSGEAKTPSFELVPPMHVRGKLQFMGGGEVSIDQILREENPGRPRTRQALKDEK